MIVGKLPYLGTRGNSRSLNLKRLSSEIYLAESGINQQSLLKGDASPSFSADVAHHLTCERLFKRQRHLIQDMRYDEPISNYCAVSGSGLFLIKY
jgi:hypothetical protein